MERYTIQQREQIVDIYYQKSCSVKSTFRALRKIYGQHKRPTERYISKLVEKVKRTGSVANETTGRRRSKRTTENINAVSESVEEKPNLSLSQRSQELGLSSTTTWRIMHEDLTVSDVPLAKVAPSAYMLWLEENREQIKEDNPGLKDYYINKKGDKLWQTLENKTKWEQKAIKMNEGHRNTIKEYESKYRTRQKSVYPVKEEDISENEKRDTSVFVDPLEILEKLPKNKQFKK